MIIDVLLCIISNKKEKSSTLPLYITVNYEHNPRVHKVWKV